MINKVNEMNENIENEKKKNMPEDRWSKYRDKDGVIESEKEGVYHPSGDEIEDPIFDIYDDPDAVSDAKDYIDALVSYEPSGAILSNLKRKINDYQNTKNPVGEIEYWDDAIEAIEEEQENRRDNEDYVSADDNSSPWTSRMIMDNMKEHAKYLQEQNQEETEEEQTTQETKPKVDKSDTRLQEAGQNAENQTLLTPDVETKLEKLFWSLARKKQYNGLNRRWDNVDYYKSLSNRRQGKDFNPESVEGDKAYLTAIKNVNDYIHNEYAKEHPEYKNIYRGVDGHWRFEFSDKDASFLNGFEKLSGKTLDTTLEKILKHDNLYKFYSKLNGMPVHLIRNREMQERMEDNKSEYYAMYDPETKSIYINSDMFNDGKVKESLLHEIQHAIQDIEGFANGTNDNAYNNDYEYSEGEKQANLTEERSNMSQEELEQNPRSKTLNTNEKTVMQDQRPVQKAAKTSDTKMQSSGYAGYIDNQKDIYSVTFTKSAQRVDENKRRMSYYHNNSAYWRETKNKDGSITYTRTLPYKQHQKTIVYDDINGKTVGKRKKAKVAEYLEAVKDQLVKWFFNDKHFLYKAAKNAGKIESYMRMMVMKD